jgi:hypothetical protein
MTQFAAWDEGLYSGFWGRVTERTEQTVTVEKFCHYAQSFVGYGRRLSPKQCVLFDTEQQAQAFAAAVTDLYNRQEQANREHVGKLNALFEAARAKTAGGHA